jgi:hypothetical protein
MFPSLMTRRLTASVRMLRLTAFAAVVAVAVAIAGPALAHDPLPTCLATAPSSCLYHSPDSFTPAVLDLVLLDPARDNHPVPIRVRYPLGATGARPVVIWSHGGSTTSVVSMAGGVAITRGQQSSVRRSESFARAGYVVIHIGRLPPATLTNAQLQDCATAGVIVGGVLSPDTNAIAACKLWTGWHIYGPQNVAFVASMLQHYQVGMLPGFEGTLDRERLVVGGWSGGTESALNIAGAYQRWSNLLPPHGSVQLDPVPVPGVVAFFTDAPRGPDWAGYSSGFQEDSPYGIDGRPILFNTAVDDRGPDKGPVVSRNASFFGAAKGGKVMSYSWTRSADGGPNHGTMDINDSIDEATGEPASGCDTALREQHCVALESLGVAFLDAAVRGLPGALAWMASGNLQVMTSDRIELYTR